MLIAGCCCCGASDAGALGFSNERSLVYWARTFSWGGGASGGAPLPLVMSFSVERFQARLAKGAAEPAGTGNVLVRRVAIIGPRSSTRTTEQRRRRRFSRPPP